MHYEITASLQTINKHLTSAQRNSSLFSEAPRIGGVTLRRGQVLKFNQDQMRHNDVMLRRLFDAGAIEIFQVTDTRRIDLRVELQAERAQLEDVKEEMRKLDDSEKSEPLPEPKVVKMDVPEEEDKRILAEVEKAGAEGASATISTPEPLVAETVVAAADAVVEVAKEETPALPAEVMAAIAAPIETPSKNSKKGRK